MAKLLPVKRHAIGQLSAVKKNRGVYLAEGLVLIQHQRAADSRYVQQLERVHGLDVMDGHHQPFVWHYCIALQM